MGVPSTLLHLDMHASVFVAAALLGKAVLVWNQVPYFEEPGALLSIFSNRAFLIADAVCT